MQKTFRILLVSFAVILGSLNSISAQYCIPTTTRNPDYGSFNFYIDRVRIGDIDNQDSFTPADTSYNDYTQYGPWTNLTRGSVYTITINAGPNITYYASLYYAAWIDYNNDGDFSDAGENLFQQKGSVVNDIISRSITIPSTASISKTRLRVRCTYSVSPITVDPCATYTYGETEDYTVGISDFIKTPTTIDGADEFDLEFFNMDADSDYDLIMIDEYDAAAPVNFLTNNGSGTFSTYNYINSVTPVFNDYNMSFNLCDLNNDNGLDLLLTSRNGTSTPRTTYFQKNGTQLYQTNTGITDLMWGSSATADFNNDGRQDVIICGRDAGNIPYTFIYMNSTSGFILVNDKLKGVYGKIAVADYDNDRDVDILLTGTDRYGNSNSIIYRNDNNWKFTDIYANIYKYTGQLKPQFCDFNNDGLLDLLCGKAYRNDGNGVFTELKAYAQYGIPFLVRGVDIDNDGITDIIGQDEWGVAVYKYNGLDSLVIHQHLIGYGTENLDIADVNGDRKQDIIVNDYQKAYIFRNQTSATNSIPGAPPEITSSIGDSGFYSVTLKWKAGTDDKTPVSGLTYNLRVGTSSGGNQIFSSMTATTTNNPLLKPGMGNVYTNRSWFLKDLAPGTYYWSVQTVDNSGLASAFSTEKQFTILAPLTQSSFLVPGRLYQACAGADFDGDKDIDLIIKDAVLTIHRQTAPYTYAAIPLRANCELLGISDLNNDNLPDIIVKHNKQAGEVSDSLELFVNLGNMNFRTVKIDSIFASAVSTAAAADFDNDGDIDILIHCKGDVLFENTGNLNFTRKKLNLTESLYSASVSAIDIDLDGDFDFIIAGKEGAGFSASKCYTLVYENTGSMNFSLLQAITPAIGSASFYIDVAVIATYPSDITWNDFNFDGYPDLLLTGEDEYKNSINQIFLNDGTGLLVATSLSPRPADRYSSTWIDFNTDGYLDIIMPRIGYTVDNSIYFNNNNTAYEGFGTAIDNIPFPAFIKAIDVDNDKDKDILVTNKIDLTVGFRTETVIYTNNNNFVNQAPNAPTSASHEIDVFDVILNWNKGWDKLTVNNGLTYNIWVGTANNKADIISPMADLTSGYRFVEALGNVGTNTSWRIKNLPLGTYYWSVQTIDNSLTPSAWAPVKSFTLSALTANFKTDTVCFGTVTHFTDVSVTTSPILSWLWDFGDGNISTQQNPSFMFTGAGNNPVKLVVTSAVAKDSVTINVMVKNVPEAKFSSTIVCAGNPTSFTNTTNLNSLTVNEWHWDFGDGSGSNVKDPGTHGYLVPGNYNAILVAVATNGCSDTVSNSVAIGTIPNAAISSGSRTSFCSGDSVVLANALFSSYNYTWQLDGVDITGADQNTFSAKDIGSYTVTVINPVGNCRDTSSPVIVTVKEKPVKPGIDKGNYITGKCIGEKPIRLSIKDPIPGYNYTWYKNEVPFSNSTSLEGFLDQANYYVRAELDECIVFSDDTAKVYSPDSPPKPVINAKGPTVWYLMSSITNASKYKWYFNGQLIPDATKSFYIAHQKLGKYNLSISNDGVCYTISDTLIIPMGITGIEDADPFTDVRIYPNPTTGLFTIEMDNNIHGELIIDIYNQNGSKALNIKFEKTTEHFSSQIDLSGQSKGMYLVNLSLDKFRAVRKVVVE